VLSFGVMDKTCLKLIECIFHFMDGYPSICDGFSFCYHSFVFHCMRLAWPQCIIGHNNKSKPSPQSTVHPIPLAGLLSPSPFCEFLAKMSADSRTELCTRSICLSIVCGHTANVLHILTSQLGGI